MRGLDLAARKAARRAIGTAVDIGAPPGWFGYRHVVAEDPAAYARRRQAAGGAVETIHDTARASNPLPVTVAERNRLPDTRHWWGYSMRDVPSRTSGPTLIVTLPDARIVSYRNPRGEFYPAILGAGRRALDTREVKFRNGHAEVLRQAIADRTEPVRLRRATWILERVCDNHSHWLTAHLPKLQLLRETGRLEGVLLPQDLTPAQDASIRLLGIDPDPLPRHDPSRPLDVDELTLLVTDRFRPELLRPVRDAIAPADASQPFRRIFITRARARFRRLRNEAEIGELLDRYGFETVALEDLGFRDQVALMRQARVVLAPHGAGLTNVMFCREGTHVAEIASPDFPNPNFYALSAAMGHRYHLVPARSRGSGPPLERDLHVDPATLKDTLEGIEAALAREARAEG
ncbi:glycosyltransferase family 61 protein [Wenxinia saemankumensis]|uniref:glycosyltransferase family 61 protein n=1 Tax=Wenxinia saemankumensis TaxID=1447782 RepID=UPI001480763B|nr:glycosyltransferase family 61 protein [Wenxinia saemankumensis]